MMLVQKHINENKFKEFLNDKKRGIQINNRKDNSGRNYQQNGKKKDEASTDKPKRTHIKAKKVELENRLMDKKHNKKKGGQGTD